MAESARKDLQDQDTDEWWRECRLLARRLIDQGDVQAAYRVVREVALPANRYYRAEWLDRVTLSARPEYSIKHFTHIDDGLADSIVLARAGR